MAHPAMPMPGSMLLGFRTTEYALHGWDLAHAIGVDDSIDPAVLEVLVDDFVDVVLVDELNRATPRTQSALLEAMEEHQVTVDGVTYA